MSFMASDCFDILGFLGRQIMMSGGLLDSKIPY
jgi:hypothetical protein